MLILVDLLILEVIVAPELGIASSHRVGGFQQVVAEIAVAGLNRSEERRVGKECRSRWSPYH